MCIKHWRDGDSWESSGVYNRLREKIANGYVSDHGISNETEIISRYQKLDHIFNKIKSDQLFMKQKELDPKNYKEKGGVLIHLGPNGEPFFGLKGHHRFAMAYILGIPFPAQIGIVHSSALDTLKRLRVDIKNRKSLSHNDFFLD